MGDASQHRFIADNRAIFPPPYLEIGSKLYPGIPVLRDLFPGEDYLGVDLSPGPGVDVAADLAGPFERVDAALGGRRFNSIFCLSVLEHCARPWVMAAAAAKLLAPGGRICVSAPFAWKRHDFPADYWRFTPDGIKALFHAAECADAAVSRNAGGGRGEPAGETRVDFDDALSRMHTASGSLMPVDSELGRLVLASPRWHFRRGRKMRGIEVALARAVAVLGPLRWLFRHRYVLPPTLITMVGTLRRI